MYHKLYALFAFINAVALVAIAVFVQSFTARPPLTHIIILQNEAAPIAAPTFFVADVEDGRAGNSAVAWLVAEDNSIATADLQGGTLTALQSFMYHNVTSGNKLRPIVIEVKQLKVVESALSGRRVDGKVTVNLSFGIRRADGIVHLIDYEGGMRYNRPAGNQQPVEPALRHSLINALVYFNNWMNKQADINPQLATAVKLSFTDYAGKMNGDTIYYDANRPLTWADFRDKDINSRYTADVFPWFGFDEHVAVKEGIIYLKVAMRVYLPKSDCRVKYDAHFDEVLNHEQRHFDIVKIISERYKQHLMSAGLTPENCDGALHADYFEYLHQMNLMQDAYDDETRHGQKQAEQQHWDKKINEELKSFSIRMRS